MTSRHYVLGWPLHDDEAADSEVSFEPEPSADDDDGAEIDFPVPGADGGD